MSSKSGWVKAFALINCVLAVFLACASVFWFLFPRHSDMVSAAEKYAKEYGLEKSFVLAVIKCESGFNEKAVSPAGAVGVMQLMPETAKYVAEKMGIADYDLYSFDSNIRLGCAYIFLLKGIFSSEKTLLAAYNAGEGKVREWLKNSDFSKDGVSLKRIPFKETARYVLKVRAFKSLYRLSEDIFGNA